MRIPASGLMFPYFVVTGPPPVPSAIHCDGFPEVGNIDFGLALRRLRQSVLPVRTIFPGLDPGWSGWQAYTPKLG